MIIHTTHMHAETICKYFGHFLHAENCMHNLNRGDSGPLNVANFTSSMAHAWINFARAADIILMVKHNRSLHLAR